MKRKSTCLVGIGHKSVPVLSSRIVALLLEPWITKIIVILMHPRSDHKAIPEVFISRSAQALRHHLSTHPRRGCVDVFDIVSNDSSSATRVALTYARVRFARRRVIVTPSNQRMPAVDTLKENSREWTYQKPKGEK